MWVCDVEGVVYDVVGVVYDMVGFNGCGFVCCSLYLESIVDVEGVVSAAPEKITGCTQQDVELQVTKVSNLRRLVILVLILKLSHLRSLQFEL